MEEISSGASSVRLVEYFGACSIGTRPSTLHADMECNKDEALRAKEISELKLVEKDFVGAKKIAQKAEKLFPGLEGLSHLFQILDVYISSEKKVNGVSDWYSVLGVDPTSDDETIRKSYRKLALSLHPDKNKSLGAEGAFKLVSEAWTILSDKIKRKVYDQKRNPRPVYQKVVTQTQKTSTSTPQPPKPNTFWTSCTKCKMHFEYLKVYLNQKILCTNCREPFWALAISAPPTNRHPIWHSQKQNHTANHQVNIGGQMKRPHEVKGGAVKNQNPNSGLGSVKVDGFAKKRRVGEQSTVEREKVNVPTVNKTNNSTRELSNAEIRTVLMTKARKEIRKKLDEWKAEEELKKEISKKESEINSGKKNDEKIIPNDLIKEKDVKTPSKDTLDDMDTETKDTEAILMSVPDPDFHDFDMDRTERAFSENQVWAAYDEDDGMPRYYAMIHTVISRKPFKMEISWLNSKSNAELAPINWVASGFPKTSGDFRIGKHEINTSLNSFSHRVHWEKGKKGIIQIYPRKGEVWAVYKNWCPDWNEFTPDEVIHKYDMVVVLEDYEEEKGITVTPLVKVGGFKSVFHEHGNVLEAWMIPKEEMFRLSHKVPYYVLTGEEGSNVPKGCLELDPAALPLELLKSTVEEKVKAVEVKGIITYARKRGKIAKVVLENDGR